MRAKAKSRKSIPVSVIALSAVLVAVLVVVSWRWSGGMRAQEAKPAAAATYVGQERCAQCHAEQVQAWRTSHHALAMQVASDSTVLGDFHDTHFTKGGIT